MYQGGDMQALLRLTPDGPKNLTFQLLFAFADGSVSQEAGFDTRTFP